MAELSKRSVKIGFPKYDRVNRKSDMKGSEFCLGGGSGSGKGSCLEFELGRTKESEYTQCWRGVGTFFLVFYSGVERGTQCVYSVISTVSLGCGMVHPHLISPYLKQGENGGRTIRNHKEEQLK